MKITYYSDYTCPYCYIGETRLKKAIAEIIADDSVDVTEPIELEMHTFRLNPDAPNEPDDDTVTQYAKKYRMSPMLAKHQADKISNMGRREGLEFNYAETRSVNTFDAHRLTKYALTKNPETAEALADALFQAYFGDNLILTDEETLVSAGKSAGLGKEEVRDVLSCGTFAEEVLLDEENARKKGVTGVPYFEIGDRTLSGAEPIARFKDYIISALKDTGNNKEITHEPGHSAPHTCGPEGCHI